MKQQGYCQEEIARAIGFGQPTVSKELRRNAGKRGYRPKQAHEQATKRKAAKRRRSKVIVGEVRSEVERRLSLQHSPEQISGALGEGGPSHESIYRFIHEDKLAGGDLHRNLRINGKRRYRRRSKAQRTKIPNRTPISERPKLVDQRKRYGDWEADLIEGAKGSGYILSLYERRSMLGKLVKLESKTSVETSQAIIAALGSYQVETITYDNGLEFALHEEVSRELEAVGYFCEPYHSWEKGGVENFNGLVRQYFPKGADFSAIEAGRLAEVERLLNERPRKTHSFKSPSHFEPQLAA
jgi:IS30 family transposase